LSKSCWKLIAKKHPCYGSTGIGFWQALRPIHHSVLVSASWSNDHNVSHPFLRVDFQMCDLAILDMSFDRCSVRRMKLEVRCPVARPRRQQLNPLPFRLHEHYLQRHHAGSTVIEVGNPIAPRHPEPRESLIAVVGKLVDGSLLGHLCKSQHGGLWSILTPASIERIQPRRK